jgi:hypothetical protein
MKNIAYILAAMLLTLLPTPSAWALEHNITAIAITNPPNGSRTPVNIGVPIRVDFKNNGTANDSNVIVTAFVRNGSNVIIYRDTIVIDAWSSGETKEIAFRDFTPTVLGDHKIFAVSNLENDELPSDDTASSFITNRYEADAKAVSVIVPTPDGSIPAKLGFRARGFFAELGVRDLYDVKARMQIRNCSNNALVIQIDSTIPELIYDDGNVPFEFPSRSATYDTRKLNPGCYKIALICSLPDDGDRNNDTAYAFFEVVATTLAHDMKADSVLTPKNGTSIPNPTNIPITIRFRNSGNNDESNIKVVAAVTSPKGIVLYRDTATIDLLIKGGTQDVAFNTFVFGSQSNYFGNYIFSGAILLTNDEFNLDDTIRSSVTLGTAQDVQAVEILDPHKDEVKPGGIGFGVKVTFRTSWGTGEFLNVPVRVVIHECKDNQLRFQADTVIPKLNVDSGLFTVIFPMQTGTFNTASLPAGCYNVRAFHRLSFDGNRKNDTVKSNFTIAPFLSHNISALTATAPLDKSHGGKLIAVAVKYQNTGVNNESSVKLLAVIKDRDGNVIYRDSAYESNWMSSEERTKGFKNFTLPADGIYTLYGICSMVGDVSRSDDTVLSHFSSGQVIDAEAVAVMYPSLNDDIKEGTLFNPIGSFRWAGGYDDKYPVPVSVEIRSCDDNLLVYRADTVLDTLRIEDEEKQITFPSTWDGWDITRIRDGCYKVAVIAKMEFDGNRKNDTAYKLVSIIPANSVHMKETKQVLTIEANYPNPFATHTEMTYELMTSGTMSIHLIGISGRLIETITANTFISAGKHSFTIDASHLPSGTYFVEMLFKDTEGKSSRIVKPIIVQKN